MTESSESQSTASDVTVLEAAVGFSDPDLDLLLLLLSTGAKILGNWKPGTEELDSRAPVVTVEGGAADLELPFLPLLALLFFFASFSILSSKTGTHL